jgi:hypothetical protein
MPPWLDLTGLDLVKLEEKTESDRILPNRVVGEILAKCCECIGKMLLGGRANDLVVLGGVGHDRLGERWYVLGKASGEWECERGDEEYGWEMMVRIERGMRKTEVGAGEQVRNNARKQRRTYFGTRRHWVNF